MKHLIVLIFVFLFITNSCIFSKDNGLRYRIKTFDNSIEYITNHDHIINIISCTNNKFKEIFLTTYKGSTLYSNNYGKKWTEIIRNNDSRKYLINRNLFPNPAFNEVNIPLSQIVEPKDISCIFIANIIGSKTVISSYDLKYDIVTIDISSFKEGNYWVFIEMKDKSICCPLIISH